MSAFVSSARPASKARLRCESLEAREVPALFVGGDRVLNIRNDYLAYIKYLTVPEDKRDEAAELEVFNGTNVAAIKKLEDPLRRQIFTSMYFARNRDFNFPDLPAAEQNFGLRVEIVSFMNMVTRQNVPDVNTLGLQFGYYGTDPVTHVYHAPSANPAYWEPVPFPGGVSRAFRSLDDDSYAAIMALPEAPYWGECYGTIQIAILYSAARVLGPAEFNAKFPNGLVFGTLSNWNQLSIAKLLPQDQQFYEATGDKLGRANMVPGDWVYMKNNNNYGVVNPNGYWHGENSIYMGRYDLIRNGRPVYKPAATPRFTGLGVDDKSERQLRNEVWKMYCIEVLGYSPHASWYPPPKGVRWTVTVGPGTGAY